ncbi:hypothetical protein RDI58_017631 [Solanum bulbocastanum]|uniref:GATA-type domain-containing protein n=1 Tax=Solanum bulbocastanum TaxID=147425 RepID=A0AAN8TFT7_SOLBU
MTPPDHITPNFPFGLNNNGNNDLNNSLVPPNYQASSSSSSHSSYNHFFFNSTTNQTASFHHQHTQYYMQHEHQLEVDNDGGSSYDLGKKNKGGSGLKLSLWKREDKLVMSSEIEDLDQERKKNTINNACIKLKLGDQKQQPIQTDYSSNNIPIRVCTDCNTTKTPLWRSGPKGPKSLCNACGIRQRKARRTMAAAEAATNGKTDHQTTMKITKVRTNNDVRPLKKRCKFGPSSSTNNAPKKLGFEDLLINLSNKLAFQQIFPQDEKEAAILLMALSSGLVHG